MRPRCRGQKFTATLAALREHICVATQCEGRPLRRWLFRSERGESQCFWAMWQVLQRLAARTILPHFAQRLDFLASLALVRGRRTIGRFLNRMSQRRRKTSQCTGKSPVAQLRIFSENFKGAASATIQRELISVAVVTQTSNHAAQGNHELDLRPALHP